MHKNEEVDNFDKSEEKITASERYKLGKLYPDLYTRDGFPRKISIRRKPFSLTKAENLNEKEKPKRKYTKNRKKRNCFTIDNLYLTKMLEKLYPSFRKEDLSRIISDIFFEINSKVSTGEKIYFEPLGFFHIVHSLRRFPKIGYYNYSRVYFKSSEDLKKQINRGFK